MVLTLDLDPGPPSAYLWLFFISASLGFLPVTMTERPCVNDHSFALTQVVTFSNMPNIAHRRAVDAVLWGIEWFAVRVDFWASSKFHSSMLLFLHTSLGVTGML